MKIDALIVAEASAVIAVIALVISFLALYLQYRSFRLDKAASEAKRPALVPYLIDSSAIRFIDHRTYAFCLLISNTSDNANAVSGLDLEIVYTQIDHHQGNLLFRHDPALASDIDLAGGSAFSIPAQIGPHQSITGWALFRVTKSLLQGKDIEGYRVHVRDTHSIEVQLTPIVITERQADETSAKG